MLPTRWEGKNIVVMDQVTVMGPGYKSEDCKAGKEAGSALARVKKVVSGIFFSVVEQRSSSLWELAAPMVQRC